MLTIVAQVDFILGCKIGVKRTEYGEAISSSRLHRCRMSSCSEFGCRPRRFYALSISLTSLRNSAFSVRNRKSTLLAVTWQRFGRIVVVSTMRSYTVCGMRETYQLIGYETAWFNGALCFALIGGKYLADRRKGRAASPLVIGCLLTASALQVFGLPFTWLVAVGCVVGAVWLVRAPDKTMSNWGRFSLAASYAALGFFMLLIPATSRIILTDESATSREGKDENVAPRAGLRVHATSGSTDWLYLRPSASWTSYGADGSEGPGPFGRGLYCGPRGLIMGDDLGKHIAAWAGTKPVYQTARELEAKLARGR